MEIVLCSSKGFFPGRPKAQPATQNASRKSLGKGNKIRKLGGRVLETLKLQ